MPGNVIVGPNNSGKSSILDAFRLLEACIRLSKTRNPQPMTVEGGGVHYGYEIADSSLPFSLANITTDYSDEDAILEFRTDKKYKCVIRLHPDRMTRFYIDAPGETPNTSTKFRKLLAI